MDKKIPKISVVVSVYNGEKYLKEAIESILNQTEKDFELIIIDDGSFDTTEAIIKSFTDERIKYYKKNHEGLVSALNFGVQQAQALYIARMDADDIAKLERLEKQLSFMKSKDLVVCGTYADIIDQAGTVIGNMSYPPNQFQIKLFTLLHNPFIHPSVMIRRDIFEKVGGYRKFFRHIEDYELWTRIVFRYKTDNLPESLLQYRVHGSQITKNKLFGIRTRGVLVRILALYRFIFRW